MLSNQNRNFYATTSMCKGVLTWPIASFVSTYNTEADNLGFFVNKKIYLNDLFVRFSSSRRLTNQKDTQEGIVK